jgi:hypothetical protein
MTLNYDDIQSLLRNYPFVKFCFEKYINWIFSIEDLSCIREFPLIDMMLSTSDRYQRTQELENKLLRSKQILKLDGEEFRERFGFKDNLLTHDKGEIHNILAEPLFVLDLSNNNFGNIEKISRRIRGNDKQIKLADFRAEYNGECFAIELKTTMMESTMENGKFLGGGKDEAIKMLINNCLKKIEEKNHKVLEQLNNTCKLYNCTKKMIAFYNRRLCVEHYLQPIDFINVACEIHSEYSNEVDYVSMKNYSATVIVFYPDLSNR